jgi:hypothetical protein
MPINPLSVPNFSVTPYSGGADFSQLANLGNVFQEGQMQNRRLAVLGQMGNDPTQNAMLMIRSGDPKMVQTGLELQNQITTQARYAAQQQEQIRQFNETQKFAREKFEAEDPDTRLASWQKLHPGEDPNSPAAQAYAFKQPQLLHSMMPAMIQKRYLDNQAAMAPASDIIDNLDEMKRMSAEGTKGGLIGKAEIAFGQAFPQYAPKSVENALNMRTLATQNILQQVKTLFPNRVLKSEFKTLQMLENPENYADSERQFAYEHLKKLVQTRITEMQNENARIESGKLPGMPATGGGAVPIKAEGEEKPALTTAASTEIATPKNEEEYKALPSGTRYRHPDDPPGKFRTKK